MLGRQQQVWRRIRKLADASVACLAFWLAHWVRSHWQIEVLGGAAEIQPFADFAWLLLLIFPLAPLLLEWHGFYDRLWTDSRAAVAWRLLRTCISLPIILIIFMFFLKVLLARSVFPLFGVACFLLLLLKEELTRYWRASGWAQAQLVRRFILVGTRGDNARLREELQHRGVTSIKLVAQLDLGETPVERLSDWLHQHSANGVILNTPHAFFGQIEKAIQICELEGVEAWLLADFFKTQISRTMVDNLLDRPMLVFRSTPEESWQAVVKQLMDVLVALFLLTFSSWLFLLVAAGIKILSPGPVFFRQKRCGLNGHPFTMYKFRSMVSDAEQRRHELEMLNEMSGPVFKLTSDPRVTTIGRWLRRFSVDELPQLWNVLRGEMSLVGPRPLPVDEVQRFDDLAHRRRLSVKPGLTCLWQISGRNEVSDFKEWVRLDLEYIDNWSLGLDLRILMRTIPAVLRGTGAK